MSNFDSSLRIFDDITENNLYPKLLDQLNKDFQLAGIDDEIDNAVPVTELHHQLTTIIYGLINHNFSDYLNLLYRVDISEYEIKSRDGSDIEKLSEQVSILILKRECQKVWLRNTL